MGSVLDRNVKDQENNVQKGFILVVSLDDDFLVFIDNNEWAGGGTFGHCR
jgi:hypothetical protein